MFQFLVNRDRLSLFCIVYAYSRSMRAAVAAFLERCSVERYALPFIDSSSNRVFRWTWVLWQTFPNKLKRTYLRSVTSEHRLWIIF